MLAVRHLGPQLGRTVMLAPPNGGSELATRLGRFALFGALYGPAGAQLGPAADRHIGWGAGLADCLAWPADRPVLVIAGTARSIRWAGRCCASPTTARSASPRPASPAPRTS